LACAAPVVAAADIPSGLFVYAALLLGIAVMVALCARRWAQGRTAGKRLDLWEPATAYSLLTLGYAAFASVWFLTTDPRFRLWQLGSDSWILNAAVAVIGAGLAALWAGYGLGARIAAAPGLHRLPRAVVAWRERLARGPDVTMTLVIYGLALAARVERMAAGRGAYALYGSGLGVADQTVAVVADLSYFVLGLAALQVFLKRWRPAVLYYLLAIECVFAALTGFINDTAAIGFVIAGALYHAEVRLRRCWWWIPLFLMVVLVITPVTIAVRAQILSGRTPADSIQQRAALAREGLSGTWGSSPGVAADLAYVKLVGRLGSDIQVLGMLLRYVPERVGYLDVREIVEAPLYVVPRVLWPDKPSPNHLGGLVSRVFFDEEDNSVAATAFGDLYFHGGLTVVVIGMFALGVFMALLYRALAPGPGAASVPLIALWLSLAFTVVNPEYAYGSMIQALLQKPLVIVLAALLVCRRRTAGFEAAEPQLSRAGPGLAHAASPATLG
jgi:hypothetical protein